MAVTVNAVSSAQTEAGGTSHTHGNLTIGTISNSALVVCLITGADPGAFVTTTWAGVAMTLIGSQTNATSGRYAFLYGIKAPTTGANNIVFAWTNSVDSIVFGVAYDGVDQTGGATTFAHFTSATGNSTAPSVTITSASGNATVDTATASTFAAGSTHNQTKLYSLSGAGNIDGGAGRGAPSGASITHTWTISSAQWVMVGVDVVALGGGGGETITMDKWFSRPADVIRRKRGMVPSGTMGIKS